MVRNMFLPTIDYFFCSELSDESVFEVRSLEIAVKADDTMCKMVTFVYRHVLSSLQKYFCS